MSKEITYTEEEFNNAITDLNKKHEEEKEKELRFVRMDHKLDNIATNVKHTDNKVSSHIDKEEINNKKVVAAIENVGKERRVCEDNINKKIETKVKERNELIEKLNNHVNDNFVTTKSLNKYAVLIVLTVGITVSVITYIGQSKSLGSDQIKDMIKTVVKEMKKGG